MKATKTVAAGKRKRPVNLTLGKDVIRDARQLTDDLSGVVESLLAEYIESEKRQLGERSKNAQATAALWNAFEEQHDSFADDYSTL